VTNSKLLLGLIAVICFTFIVCATPSKKPVDEGNFDGKYALVIGNGNYENISKLPSPKNDARDVSNVLRQLGFNVELYVDLNLEQMETAIDKFISTLSNNNTAEGFFYFAGQGLTINDFSYLTPIDSSANNNEHFIMRYYAMEKLFNKLIEADNAVNVVVIDARFRRMTLPFFHGSIVTIPVAEKDAFPAGNDGLELLSQFTNDIFYLQAFLPGRLAGYVEGSRNSPFTRALLKNITRPEIFTELVKDIMADTLEFTNGQQHPYFRGNIINYENYIIKQ